MYAVVRRCSPASWLPPSGGSMARSILIVDDNELVRSHLRYFFQLYYPTFELHEAEDGLQAVELAPQLNPDLIILDLAMPRMNGLDAARKLRGFLSTTPIILFTMHASIIPESEIRSSGVSAVVPKSSLTDLQVKVQTLLHP